MRRSTLSSRLNKSSPNEYRTFKPLRRKGSKRSKPRRSTSFCTGLFYETLFVRTFLVLILLRGGLRTVRASRWPGLFKRHERCESSAISNLGGKSGIQAIFEVTPHRFHENKMNFKKSVNKFGENVAPLAIDERPKR